MDLDLKNISFFLTMKQKIFLYREEKNITKEIPTLIDFLKSYLYAGLLPIQALSFALKQKKWSPTTEYILTKILNQQMQGKSLESCLTSGILETQGKKTRRYLNLLLLSLRIGCLSGANLVQILEKVQSKTEEKLSLDRKISIATAQIRLQSWIIILAPIFLGLVLFFISPSYILFFFNDSKGNFLLLIMIFLNVTGALVLKSFLKLD
jgi:Flp pilus assembly protein TadB